MHQKFLELVKKYEQVKQSLKELDSLLTEEMVKIGIDEHFQDEETQVVYQIVEPTGTFVSFKKLTYNRTKLLDEKKGSLSKKKAEELGYKL